MCGKDYSDGSVAIHMAIQTGHKPSPKMQPAIHTDCQLFLALLKLQLPSSMIFSEIDKE